MSTIQIALDSLREIIAGVIYKLEVWDSLYYVLETLGLAIEEQDGLGKQKYLLKVTSVSSDNSIISAAKQVLKSYPGNRGKPSESDLQLIQDALWWIENQGVQRLTNVTRYRIAESLEGIPFWGRMSIRALLSPVLPLEIFLPDIGNDGHLYNGLSSSVFSAILSGQLSNPGKPSRISVLEFFQNIGLVGWPDQRFLLLLERLVHPEVQPPQIQQKLVEKFNLILEQDGFELRPEDSQGGFPIFKVQKKASGVSGAPKYIIFASSGPKPDIVINDAVNMDISVVKYEDQCLVYDQPPPHGDLTWEMLVEWWGKMRKVKVTEELRQDLGKRLQKSLQSEPEKIFFETYFRSFKPKLAEKLPALLPQVYLHYDPRSRNERSKPILVRQRMDFLMLLRNATRIVIEIDGIQHYADENSRALPSRYAEMVAEDRRIRILGYEIYRFGGAEFVTKERAQTSIDTFFSELFARFGIYQEKG